MTAAPNRAETEQSTWRQLILRELEIVQGVGLSNSSARQQFVSVVGVLKERLARDMDSRSQPMIDSRRISYLSTNFQFGRLLRKNLEARQLWTEFELAIISDFVALETLLNEELDDSNGVCSRSVARSSALMLESISTHALPAVGYSLLNSSPLLRGMPDFGCRIDDAWLMPCFEKNQQIPLYGHLVLPPKNESVDRLPNWVPDSSVYAAAFEVPIAGANARHVVPLRLYCVERIDYVDTTDRTPSTDVAESMLVATYLLVACALRDILDELSGLESLLEDLAARFAIAFDERELVLAVPELIRLLVVEKGLTWDAALDIAQSVFVYTPASYPCSIADQWGVDLVTRVIPLHLEIVNRMSDEWSSRFSQSAEPSVQTEFWAPKRWLSCTNPRLCSSISRILGQDWLYDDRKLAALSAYKDDVGLGEQLRVAKQENKVALVDEFLGSMGRSFNPHCLVSASFPSAGNVRELLQTALYIAHLYLRIIDDEIEFQGARTFILVPAESKRAETNPTEGESANANAGADADTKEALLERTLELLAALNQTIRNDSRVSPWLTLIHLPEASAGLVDRVIAATDLGLYYAPRHAVCAAQRLGDLESNGALSMGPAGFEEGCESVEQGSGNSFDFAYDYECSDQTRTEPHCYRSPLGRVAQALKEGRFSPQTPDQFLPLVSALVDDPEIAKIATGFTSYVEVQERATERYLKQRVWSSAAIGRIAAEVYSSDCVVRERYPLTKPTWESD